MTGLVLLGTVVTVAVFAPAIRSGPAYSRFNPLVAPPSWAHPMGTDNLQRDMFNLVVRGVRISMTVVACVVVISTVVGLALGLLAGFKGGLVDDAVIRTVEVIQVVPRFFLALLVLSVYGPGIDKIILVLAATSWTFLARIVRAEVLSLKQRPFVDAARAAGASTSRIILRHLLPNILPRAIIVIVLMGSRIILIEAGLAFIGLGDALKPSLGVLASNAQAFLREAWWLSVFPGLAIVAAVLGMNLLSDGLGRSLNPLARSKEEILRREA